MALADGHMTHSGGFGMRRSGRPLQTGWLSRLNTAPGMDGQYISVMPLYDMVVAHKSTHIDQTPDRDVKRHPIPDNLTNAGGRALRRMQLNPRAS
jgi:hypothetical protein